MLFQTIPNTAAAAAARPRAPEPFSITGALERLVGKLGGWLETAILWLPNFLIAVVIVVLAALAARLARLARKLVRGVIARVGERIEATRRVSDLRGTLTYVAVLAAGTFIALGVLSLDGVVTSLLAGVGALGFAFQDHRVQLHRGRLPGCARAVPDGPAHRDQRLPRHRPHRLSLRSTEIDTLQGQRVILPNAAVYQSPLINYATNRHRRVHVACGVGYGDDLEHAEAVATAAVDGLPMRSAEHGVELFYTEFGDSSINFTLRFWIAETGQASFLAAQSAAIKAVKAAFDAGGVTIPFPIRTLDFDPNGGLALAEALKPALSPRAPTGGADDA